MAPFYGWDSTASRLQSHFEETVYFLSLSSQKFLILIEIGIAPDLKKVETEFWSRKIDTAQIWAH